jgi:hypothetical protein
MTRASHGCAPILSAISLSIIPICCVTGVVALSDQGPVFLEVNFGGDLNLAQLANGKGGLDHWYTGHRRECSFQI